MKTLMEMSSSSYSWAAVTAVFALALTTFLSTSVDAAHKCFVCRPSHADGTYATEISELRRHFRGRHVRRCEDYTRERKSEFMMECPKDRDDGCLTVFQDGSVMRTCAKVGLKDCVEMEGKTYCYCKNQLCNTPDGPLASFGNHDLPQHRRDYADDEGSGYGEDGDDDHDDEDYYYEEDITEMPPSVKMDEDVEVKDVEKPRKTDDEIFIVEDDDRRKMGSDGSGAASVTHAGIALFIALILAVGT